MFRTTEFFYSKAFNDVFSGLFLLKRVHEDQNKIWATLLFPEVGSFSGFFSNEPMIDIWVVLTASFKKAFSFIRFEG